MNHRRLGSLRSPIPPDQIRKLLEIGRKSDEELHPDFPGNGSEIANTEPRPVSTSLAVAKRVEASEGPERAGNKPLMRNPSENSHPDRHTASDTFPTLPQVLRELERRAR
jgi:hypothetical protein